MSMVETHLFAHLGPAPYRFVGAFQMPDPADAGPNGFTAACMFLGEEWGLHGIGSCYHCGTGIIDHYVISTGDGKHHAVGSSCIAKTQKKSGLIPKAAAAAKKAKNKLDTEKRHAREAVKLAELGAIMADPATRERLSALPHPRNFTHRTTGEPLTAWDDAEWTCRSAGASGKVKLLARIVRALGVS